MPHISLCNKKKLTVVSITINLIQESLWGSGNCQFCGGEHTFSKIQISSLKQILLASNTVSYFPWIDRFTLFLFENLFSLLKFVFVQSTLFLRFMHVAHTVNHSFSLYIQYSIVWIYHNLLIHLPASSPLVFLVFCCHE